MAFDRQYEISFGVPVRTFTDYIRVDTDGVPLVVRTLPSNARVITGGFEDSGEGLQIEMSATYKKNQGKKPDGTVLKIYNMSLQDRSLMEKKNAVVVVKAGYADEGNLSIIYQGDVKKVYTDQVGTEQITTVYIEDGYAAKTSARVSKNFPRNTQVSDVINFMVDTMPDVGRGSINLGTVTANLLQSGFSIHGNLAKKMDEVCKAYNLEWNINNGVVNVHFGVLLKDTPEFSSLLSRAFLIRPKNIKGSIQRMRDNNKKKPSQNLDRTALKLELFLDGRVKAGNLIRIAEFDASTRLNGTYKVSSVRHQMNFRGGNWSTTIESEKVGS